MSTREQLIDFATAAGVKGVAITAFVELVDKFYQETYENAYEAGRATGHEQGWEDHAEAVNLS